MMNMLLLSTLKRFFSHFLFTLATDIADGMIRKGMVVKAVDLAYTFGLEEKYSPQTALTSFLQKSEETWKKAKQDSNDFPSALVCFSWFPIFIILSVFFSIMNINVVDMC